MDYRMDLGGYVMSEKERKEYKARQEAEGIVFYKSKYLGPIDLEPEEDIPRRPGIPVTYPTYLAPQPLTFPGSAVPLDEEPYFFTYDDYKPDFPEPSKASEAEASEEDDGHECDDDEDHDKGKEQQQQQEDFADSTELSKASEAEASEEDDGHECDDDEDHDKGKEQQEEDFGTKPEAKGISILKRHRRDIDPAILSVSTASGTKPEVEGKSILKRHRQDIDPAISSVSTASGLNVYSILLHDTLVMSRDAVNKIVERMHTPIKR